jgi:hypothetical protein
MLENITAAVYGVIHRRFNRYHRKKLQRDAAVIATALEMAYTVKVLYEYTGKIPPCSVS